MTSPTADIPAELLINTSALFLFYPDGEPWQTVKPRVLRGMVTAFQQCGSSADETRYVVTLEPRLALLNNSLTYAVYQHKSVIGTAEDILKRHQFSSLDYRYQLNTQYPTRDFYISWDESDLTFIQRHLARVGVFYYFAYDEENRRDVMVLGDSSYAWVTGPAIPFRHPARLTVKPHLVAIMPAAKRARFSFSEQQRLGDHLVLGSETADVNYSIGVEMYTEDPEEAKGWLPGGQLREDVLTLLRVYLGCDYDASLTLTIPMKLAPLPRLGDRSLLMGYNVVMGLREDNLDDMPEKVTMKLGGSGIKRTEEKNHNCKGCIVFLCPKSFVIVAIAGMILR